MSDLVALDVVGPVLAGVYAVLAADQGLDGLLAHTDGRSGVYQAGAVPEGAGYPMVRIGQPVETPDNAHDRFGAEVLVTLDVFIMPGKGASSKTAFPIVARLRALFDEKTFTVVGHRVVSSRHELTQTVPEPRDEYRHLAVRFRISTEQE